MIEETRECKYCNIRKGAGEYYTIRYRNTHRIDWSACRSCRRLRSIAQKKIRDSKITNCLKCNALFGDNLKVTSKGLCSHCYRRYREQSGNCKRCGVQFNKNSNRTQSATKNYCRSCYAKWRNENLIFICSDCGGDIPSGSLKARCQSCLEKKKIDDQNKMVIKLDIGDVWTKKLDRVEFEVIRRLIVKYNNEMLSYVDTLRIVNIHEQICGGGNLLDNKTPSVQIWIMLNQLASAWIKFRKEEF